MGQSLAVIIMAAGMGTRMNNPSMAKVMYTINDRPLVEYVVDLALELQSAKTVVIVGWQKDSVIQHLAQRGKPVVCVEQNPQLGTGHAVMQAEAPLLGFAGDVLVLSGDVPLLSFATTHALIDFHRVRKAAATVLTTELEDPTGYGRIVRHSDGSVLEIVEQKDAPEKQQRIREINSGIYVFNKVRLFQALKQITPSNKKKEYYLTDVFGYFWNNRLPVSAMVTNDPREVMGINTPQQLEEARAIMKQRNS
jgi:UDP-N-acetylglucosamine pyrophosphorylase